MDPIQEELPVRIEIKIESFLMDTTKIFVETQFSWQVPTPPGSPFEVRMRLEKINTFIANNVIQFLSGGTK